MPRLAPQLNGQPACVEHRISFGTYERKQIAEAVDAYRRDKVLENIPNIILGVGGLVAGVGVVGIGYGVYKVAEGIFAWADSVNDFFKPPVWVNTDEPVWSEPNRENFRQKYPSKWEQAFKGPEILWAMIRQ